MELYNIKNLDIYAILIILSFFGSIEFSNGLYGSKSKRSKNDWYVELISTFQLIFLTKPVIFPVSALILTFFLPEYSNVFRESEFWLCLLIVILGDDILQYWYHRMAHTWSWLWKLHRPHHAAREMGILVSYRNALLYYILMPNIWWLGACVYCGLYQEVILAIILKQIIVTGAHSDVKWDQFLYKSKWLHPLAWIIERVISTPATHFAHHGKTSDDSISNPDGNFGNMFFIWDILFGTALITRKYPKEYGILNDPNDSWQSHLYYPFIKSIKSNSEIN